MNRVEVPIYGYNNNNYLEFDFILYNTVDTKDAPGNEEYARSGKAFYNFFASGTSWVVYETLLYYFLSRLDKDSTVEYQMNEIKNNLLVSGVKVHDIYNW